MFQNTIRNSRTGCFYLLYVCRDSSEKLPTACGLTRRDLAAPALLYRENLAGRGAFAIPGLAVQGAVQISGARGGTQRCNMGETRRDRIGFVS